MKLYLLSLLVGGGILFTLGDILLKRWATEDRYMYYAAGFVLYVIGIILFSLTLRAKNLGIANTILVTTNLVTLVLVSYFYFHEKLSPLQVGGLVLSIVGVILLEIGE